MDNLEHVEAGLSEEVEIVLGKTLNDDKKLQLIGRLKEFPCSSSFLLLLYDLQILFIVSLTL